MEILLKTAAAAVTASLVCLLVKRGSPEFALPVSLTVCLAALGLSVGMLRPVLELLDRAGQMSGLDISVYTPVLKSVGIAVCSRVSSDICKDSGQTALAGAVELTGTVCAVYTALPLMETMLSMLETLA